MDQYIGKLLDNRYELLELIGIGGMARVYKARCHRLNRLVAVKILREDMAQDAEFRRRFHDESQAVAMLSHPNIVAVYDVSRSSEMEYIVMELIDGITLKQYIQKKGNKLNWREALHFTTQIVKALGHAHSRGIIHRDIKPHNVMVLRDGSVKVADFGIARVLSASHSTLTQEALGSVHYISPEQARGSFIDARSDLYSAGVVLYEMVTGRLPFEGDTAVSVAIQHINSIPLSPREIDAEIPEALEKITMKAMAPNRDNRYGSADEMLADLEEFRKNPNINFEYDLWSVAPVDLDSNDNEKTQIHMSAAGTGNRERSRTESRRERQRRFEENDDEYEREPRGGALGGILLAVLAILGFVGVVSVFLYKTFFAGILAPAPTYQVPDLTGKVYEEVQLAEEYRDFKIVLGSTVFDDEFEAGKIIRQDPAANSTVGEAGREISVVVSSGPKEIMMIDLYNMEYRQAYLAVESMGLRALKPEYEHNDVVAYNHVISYTPLKDTVLSPGDSVQMVVSLGPESLKLDMPDLVGLTQEQAESKITFHHLEIGDVRDEYHPTVPAGSVIEQYPAAETQVSEGTKVNLQVSLGPDPSTILPPEPEPEPPADPSASQIISIQLPLRDGMVRVTAKADGEILLDTEMDAAMNTSVDVAVPAPVSGHGDKVLYVYFDNELDHKITVVF